MKQKATRLYIVCFFALCLIPTLFLPVFPTNATTENRELAPFPKFGETAWLSKAGTWFEDHYAFKEYFVTANSGIQAGLLKASPIQSIIQGTDGWLYYKDSIPDYEGTGLLTERETYSILHNIQLMKWAVESQGSTFAIMLAPNKNTVEPDHMPKGYVQTEEKNLETMETELEKAGIQTIQTTAILQNAADQVYYKTDSHWNMEGANLAYNQLMESLGLEPRTFETEETPHTGDLYAMLYPKGTETELDQVPVQTYKSNQEDPMADEIETENPQGQGRLLLYRDSFGSNLIPFLSNTFEKVWYTRLVPYNLTEVQRLKPQYTIIERVERRIASFQESAAIMLMPTVNLDEPKETMGTVEMAAEDAGGYLKLHGEIKTDGAMKPNADFYLQVKEGNNILYAVPVFYVNESGIEVYLPKNTIPESAVFQIVMKDGTQLFRMETEEKGN